MLNNCGVYKIENALNGKCYIGQSINLESRKSSHFTCLNNNSGHNSHLQSAYNKYGKDNFRYSVLIYCETFELTRYETFLDNRYKILGLSYNMRVCVDSNMGVKFSEEHKRNLRNSHIGYHPPETTLIKMRESALKGENHPLYGKHLPADTRIKISMSLKGKHFSESTIIKLSESHKGIHISEETKNKISKSHIGLYHSEETRIKMSLAKQGKPSPMKGIPRSEETKRKIGEANRLCHQRKLDTTKEETCLI
jgi:group I intron endonuclease